MTASQNGPTGQRSPLQQLTGAGTEVVQRLRALPTELPGTVSRRLSQLPGQVRELPAQVQHTRERVTDLYGTVAGRVTSAVRRGDGGTPASTGS